MNFYAKRCVVYMHHMYVVSCILKKTTFLVKQFYLQAERAI